MSIQDGKHLVVAARTFVRADETGIHPGATVCVVGGYLGSPAQWRLFDSEWRAVLRRSRIDCFHGKIFFHRKKIKDKKKNPYLNWSDRRAQDFLSSLLGTIDKRGIYPVGGAVDVPAFESFTYGEQCALAGYWTKRGIRKTSAPVPYHLAFRAMLVDAADASDPKTDLHFVIAEQRDYRHRALSAYSDMKRHVPEHDTLAQSSTCARCTSRTGAARDFASRCSVSRSPSDSSNSSSMVHGLLVS